MSNPNDPIDPSDAEEPLEIVEDSPVDSLDDLMAIAQAPKHHGALSRLYHGETNVDIVGRWKTWFAISGVFLLVGLVALVGNGLNLGIDFTGGTVWEVPAGKADVAEPNSLAAYLASDERASADATDTAEVMLLGPLGLGWAQVGRSRVGFLRTMGVDSLAARFNLRYHEQKLLSATVELVAEDEQALTDFIDGRYNRLFQRSQFRTLGGLPAVASLQVEAERSVGSGGSTNRGEHVVET